MEKIDKKLDNEIVILHTIEPVGYTKETHQAFSSEKYKIAISTGKRIVFITDEKEKESIMVPFENIRSLTIMSKKMTIQ